MKKLFFYLIITFNFSFLAGSLNAQISEIWTKAGGEYCAFIGAANMDNDPQEEIVYSQIDAGCRILIFDGLTGEIDWDSGNKYKIIYIAGYNYSNGNYGSSSPFLDLGNGLKALTFLVNDQGYNNPRVIVVGLKGGVGKIEAQKIFVPEENELGQNYPNPFNPDTKINYTVQKAGTVEIKIFNSLGQLVKTVVNEYKPMGEYDVVWDGKDDNGVAVSSGTYFYHLKIGDFVSSKKMLLLK